MHESARRQLSAVLLVAAMAWPAWPAPTGTAFTYQGRLLDSGTPPTGSYDLEFTLYDVPAGGSPVLPPITVEDVAVASGLFTVSLDFGAAAFPGEARFMEIGVRPGASSGAFTLLSGRQELRPTPNALAVPWAGVNGKPPGFADDVDDDALGALACAPGEVAKWNGAAWACAADADSGGDITDVTAGTGLTGGGTSGAVTLRADFAGSGAAATVSHSDHDHFGQAWAGSAGNGLQVQNASAANLTSALRGNATAGSGATYGVYGASASTAGSGLYGTSPNLGVQGIATATSGFTYGMVGSISGDQGAGVQGYANNTAGGAPGVYGMTFSTAGTGVFGHAQATTGLVYGVFGETYSPDGIGTYGFHFSSGGTGSGLFGQSTSTAGTGVYGWATGTTGANYGVYGNTASSAGSGVYGRAASTQGNSYGVYGTSASTAGRGIYGTATATSGVAWGVHGVTASSIGRGVAGFATATTGQVVGVQGFINSDDGSAIEGFANAITGQANGVVGSTNAPNGIGVYGGATGGGTAYGTFGFAQSSTGYGVYGWNQSLTGAAVGVYGLVYSTAGYALYGNAQATSGVNYGIYARTQSAAGYAGYFQGGVHVNGTLSKLAGSFKIDHPLDPENKYLSHSFVESPDMKNLYDGVVTTDALGYATVELPAWFEALNRDFRYQLTVIEEGDAFVLAKIARKIEGNRFVVRTSRPGVEVCWQVTGIRKDPYAEKNRIPVEEDKPEEARGRYLYPAGYGAGEERGEDSDPHLVSPPAERLSRLPRAPQGASDDPAWDGS
jgi:hypothetical protein